MRDEQAAPNFLPERYRAYLLLLARMRLRNTNNARIDPSDVVQQTMLNAHRGRDQFAGKTEAQWKAWLRQILAHVIADAGDKLPNQRNIQADLEQSASRLEALLPKVNSTPSFKVQAEEQVLRLAEALLKLLPDERTALELRFLQQPRWSQTRIAQHLGRPTNKAVAGLLARGLVKLRALLEDVR
jgi:RNA polymerase sigma-70 factor, ECF subfamily